MTAWVSSKLAPCCVFSANHFTSLSFRVLSASAWKCPAEDMSWQLHPQGNKGRPSRLGGRGADALIEVVNVWIGLFGPGLFHCSRVVSPICLPACCITDHSGLLPRRWNPDTGLTDVHTVSYRTLLFRLPISWVLVSHHEAD